MAKHFGNTQRIEELLQDLKAGKEYAREEVILESQERLRRLASKLLKGCPGVARVAAQTDDAEIDPESRTPFFRGRDKQWYFTATIRIPEVKHKVRIVIIWNY